MFILLFCLIASGGLAYASDTQSMDVFLNEEQARLKDIKLLNLDLEKASLEFKKKELQSKTAQLAHVPEIPSVSAMDNNREPLKPVVKLIGLTVNGGFKQALIQSNGILYTVKEGEAFADGLSVKSIASDKISIQHTDGKEEQIVFSGV